MLQSLFQPIVFYAGIPVTNMMGPLHQKKKIIRSAYVKLNDIDKTNNDISEVKFLYCLLQCREEI